MSLFYHAVTFSAHSFLCGVAIEIAALVGERRAGAKDEAVGFVADAAGKLLHENTS